MAIFYVKAGGTATGDGGRVTGAARTGTWSTTASEYYDNVEYIFGGTGGTAITEGDFIYVSDVHDKAIASAVTWTGSNGYNGFIYIISVDNANQDQYKAGAREYASGANDMSFYGRLTIIGMTMSAGDDFQSNGNNGVICFIDCTLGVDAATDLIHLIQDGVVWEIYGGTINIDNGGQLRVAWGAQLYIYGATFNTNSTNSDIISNGFYNGGGKVYIEGCKGLEGITTSSAYVIGEVGNAPSNDDNIDVTLINCQLSSTIGFNEEVFESRGQRLLISGCSSDSDAAEYQYYYTSMACTVEAQTTKYRNESEAWADSNKVAFEVISGPDVANLNPFAFDLPSQRIDLSDTGSDVIRVYLASTASLTDADVHFQLVYADDANKHIWNTVNTRPTDFLSGTALTTDSGSDWRDGAGALTGYNEYYVDIEVNNSGDEGSACVVAIKAFVGIASTTIYFDVVTTQS